MNDTIGLLAAAWAWAKSHATLIVSFLGLAAAVRRIEIAVRHKKSDARKDMYLRIEALSSAQSSMRSDIQALEKSQSKLREGCLVLELKTDKAVVDAATAREQSKTILALIDKTK